MTGACISATFFLSINVGYSLGIAVPGCKQGEGGVHKKRKENPAFGKAGGNLSHNASGIRYI